MHERARDSAVSRRMCGFKTQLSDLMLPWTESASVGVSVLMPTLPACVMLPFLVLDHAAVAGSPSGIDCTDAFDARTIIRSLRSAACRDTCTSYNDMENR
jgi:hypothetical protein